MEGRKRGESGRSEEGQLKYEYDQKAICEISKIF